MKEFFGFLLLVIGGFLLVSLLYLGGMLESLGVYPWYIHQQTEIIHNSNAYISAKQQMIDQYIVGYYNANGSEQQQAIVNQICTAADLINHDLTSGEANFTSQHCNGE